MNLCPLMVCSLVWFATAIRSLAADFHDPSADRDALPTVPAEFEVSLFAREPLVRQPCSMAFDAKGRLYIGMGPQYRNPRPDTPADSVVLVLDANGDGRADVTKTFATGFNAIQGLAWHGRDLWIANAPDLTVVRDLDGDDEADEYVRIYTDLGNLEHGLHGLNWAPDGRLYMSKGNSKGLTQPGRIAPKPFRDLWGVTALANSPDFPEPRTFEKGQYVKTYHDPADDWGLEGGVLRCDDGGHNLEIFSRGFRNPWDITFDSGFNWLGTDNDQTTGDRVFMPFFGAHFGWNHPWSAHWSSDHHAPTAPVSGPLFEGSGTGVVFGDAPHFPASHRGVFFINDWLRKITFLWRPRWDGALLRPTGGDWEPFVVGGKALYRPTDMEFGPDGALWILGWGAGYGAEYSGGEFNSEGRVFRVAPKAMDAKPWDAPKRRKPVKQWNVAELIEDFDGPLPVWRIDAQDELVRRGTTIKAELLEMLNSQSLSQARETWTAWALGRLPGQDEALDQWLSQRLADPAASPNLRVQAVRILAHRARRAKKRELPASVVDALQNPQARLRFEAVLALGQVPQLSALTRLLDQLAVETDQTTFYAGWQMLRRLQAPAGLKPLMDDIRPGVRKAALLALLETHALGEFEVRKRASDSDSGVSQIAQLWLQQTTTDNGFSLRGRPLNVPSPVSAMPGSLVGLVRNVKARGDGQYQLVPDGLRAGARPYTDRNYDLRNVPDELVGLDFIQTANEDDNSWGEGWLTFDALMPLRVYVAFDARNTSIPRWARESFRRTGERIRADHWTFDLYSRDFAAGPVELGGNTEDGRAGGKGNYLVVLEPLPLTSPAAATTVDAALAELANGDRERGQWLFHARGGAGCFNCHRLGDHGNNFGPDLGALGERASERHIIESMLEPNSVITEGFNLHSVETVEFEYAGMLIQESGVALTIGMANGEQKVIPKSRITTRRTAALSAMPAYNTVLMPQSVADITAYLLGPKTVKANTSRPTGQGFSVAERGDRLLIGYSGQPVADFVFRDERILRPYFANVHAPGGVKVTRNHPPEAGIDAEDHATMHPGIWLAFGDINGADFWRNKGRIEHVRFLVPPALRDNHLSFATEGRLHTAEGSLVCSLTNGVTIHALSNAWLVVWDATFRSDVGDFTFGDQEEMGFGARVATSITEKNGGLLVSSIGLKTAKGTWGMPAEWCDYSGNINGQPVGITLMTHPRNFRPSWWHNRDYGVFVANPFGRAAMKQGGTSAVTVKRGESFHLRFAAALHSGHGFSPAATYLDFVASKE